ncbi:Diaminopimelate epimerase-like protein [Aspergillus carlsbadensis]|nr:Diaminopimelate epimerase-like protein [Aspergillus carlsbadensis]
MEPALPDLDPDPVSEATATATPSPPFIPPITITTALPKIHCIDMHTLGMPTRLVITGYPDLTGPLVAQKALAESSPRHDSIRRAILHEPRGHRDSFGAILRAHTECTVSGEAHMGVLYIHGDGYSAMCGHATLAVARFLVDCWDRAVFPRRRELVLDEREGAGEGDGGESVGLVLHTPGGLVRAVVPTVRGTRGARSDPARMVRFVALPVFVIGVGIAVALRGELPGRKDRVYVSLAYCGTFILQVQLEELGFGSNILDGGGRGGGGGGGGDPLRQLQHAATQIKEVLNTDPAYREYLKFPDKDGYGAVFGVMVSDKSRGAAMEGTKGGELGVYFFGGGHIDRSPTGSAAAARAALDFARGTLAVGDSWTYHSLPTHVFGLEGMVATVLDAGSGVEDGSGRCGPVQVQIAGKAHYTGYSTIVREEGDILGENGFLLDNILKG